METDGFLKVKIQTVFNMDTYTAAKTKRKCLNLAVWV